MPFPGGDSSILMGGGMGVIFAMNRGQGGHYGTAPCPPSKSKGIRGPSVYTNDCNLPFWKYVACFGQDVGGHDVTTFFS